MLPHSLRFPRVLSHTFLAVPSSSVHLYQTNKSARNDRNMKREGNLRMNSNHDRLVDNSIQNRTRYFVFCPIPFSAWLQSSPGSRVNPEKIIPFPSDIESNLPWEDPLRARIPYLYCPSFFIPPSLSAYISNFLSFCGETIGLWPPFDSSKLW